MKGYIIDCDFLIRVVDYMYPRPTPKRVIVNHGEVLPIILVEL